jgi:hypothetical protein
MAVTLHRCPLTMLKGKGHACWRVQSALDDQGIEYRLAKRWGLPRSGRKDIIAGTGQSYMPAIQFEDGSWYRDDSAAMAEAIRAGTLDEKRAGGAAAAGAAAPEHDHPHEHGDGEGNSH